MRRFGSARAGAEADRALRRAALQRGGCACEEGGRRCGRPNPARRRLRRSVDAESQSVRRLRRGRAARRPSGPWQRARCRCGRRVRPCDGHVGTPCHVRPRRRPSFASLQRRMTCWCQSRRSGESRQLVTQELCARLASRVAPTWAGTPCRPRRPSRGRARRSGRCSRARRRRCRAPAAVGVASGLPAFPGSTSAGPGRLMIRPCRGSPPPGATGSRSARSAG